AAAGAAGGFRRERDLSLPAPAAADVPAVGLRRPRRRDRQRGRPGRLAAVHARPVRAAHAAGRSLLPAHQPGALPGLGDPGTAAAGGVVIIPWRGNATMQRQGPAPPPALQPGEVHVWWATLDPPADLLGGWRRLLSADEAARAERFHFPRDRD